MNQTLKKGDNVCYGVSHGILLGIYDNNHTLFFSDYEREYFRTAQEIMSIGGQVGNILFLFIGEYFGYHNLTQQNKQILKQRRFATPILQDLHRVSYQLVNNDRSLEELIRRRHNWIVMGKNYLRRNCRDILISRVCDKIETIQEEIDTHLRQTLFYIP